MGCSQSSAAGTLEGQKDTSAKPRRSEAKFVPPRPGQLYVRPEEHKKNSDDHSQDPDEIADWKALWRPSSIDEAGSLLVRQLRLQDRCCEEQAGALLDVLCNAFHSDSACVAILEPPLKVLVWSGRGLCETGTNAPWMLDFLQCCLNSPHNEVAIVEDTSRDARVKDSEAVACVGGIASFCGAPLVAANGIRIGALCVFRGEPTRYDAVPIALLAGMAELTMRQLAADTAKEHSNAKGLLRPKAAYETATMLVDASQHAWKVLYLDSQASTVTGISVSMAGASTFWGLFSSSDAPGDHSWKGYANQTENSLDFMLHNMQRRGSSNHTVFSLAFTPLAKVMDESTIPIGIPCMTEAHVASRNFYFVRVHVQTDALPEQRTLHQAVPIPGLELGTLLAASPYGRMHRGFYKGHPVAVKIVANGRRNVRHRDGRPLAIAVTEGLRESGVPLVRTYQYATHCACTRSSLLSKPDQASGIPEGEVCACGEVIANCTCEAFEDDRRSLCQMSDSACSLNEGDHSPQETWLVQEYCSLGTLQLAIAQGKFQKSNGRACCTAILDVACDIAYAMHLLHSQGITHGNLSASSVLLTPSSCYTQKHSYGFRAKVSDYGILRELDSRGFATPQCYPILAHLAPEVLLHGKVSKAADVYAFGVLLWEMAAGQRMFAGMPWAQVMAAVTLRHSRPRLPPGRAMPSGLESVLRMCLLTSPADRPGFSELTNIIRALRTSGLHKAAEKRQSMAAERADKRRSMAVERPGHSRSSSASGLSPQGLPQEGAGAAQGPADTKHAAAQLWGSKAWRQRSLKPEALSEWQGRCDQVAAQVPINDTQPGGSGSLPARAPKAGEPENRPRARSFPAAEKPSSPYASVTKAKAASIRLSIEVRRATLTGKPRAPSSGQPAPAHAKPAGLPPSALYQSSWPRSGGSSGDAGSRGGSGERLLKDGQKPLGSKGSSKTLSTSSGGDDRLGLNEVAMRRQKGSLGGYVGSYSSCHSESGFTHTAAHLSFTEIKQQKSKNLAVGLSALRDSLLPETQRINSCTEATPTRDFVSLEDTTYIPSGSLEKVAIALPQIRVSSSCYRY